MAGVGVAVHVCMHAYTRLSATLNHPRSMREYSSIALLFGYGFMSVWTQIV